MKTKTKNSNLATSTDINRKKLRKAVLLTINEHQGHRTLADITGALADVMLDVGLSALELEKLDQEKLKEIISNHENMPTLASALVIQACVINEWINTEDLLSTSLLTGEKK